ncbi:MAG: cyclic nucleotide-binding domain-containing protein [Brevinematales bacterium]|nr:cyclic nucleotide-binding domain-containing protein [Brevinematales bacterium]
MPIERKYSQGSIIYFEHEEGDEIYILKSGRLDISYLEPQSGEKITKTLNQGEFLGLKSAVINHTRDEMAEAITDCICVVFKTKEFEDFVAKKVDLLKRLLQVLSNQLRNLGYKVNNYLGNNVLEPPNIGLFKIGEYYLTTKKYRQAKTVYERYIKAYPETNLIEEAQYRIKLAEEAIRTGLAGKYKPVNEIIGAEAGGTVLGVADVKTGQAPVHSKLGLREFMDSFYKAEGFYKAEQYEDARKLFVGIMDSDNKIVSSDLRNRAKFTYIETLHKLKDYMECTKIIMEFVQSTKDPTLIKQALFILVEIYKEIQKPDMARGVLQKIVMLTPIDQLSRRAKEMMDKM